MNLTGVFINAICVFAAGILGSIFKKGIPERIKRTLMLALGLCVLYVGIDGIVAGMDAVLLVLSVSIGAFIGEAIDFDDKFSRLGRYVESRMPKKNMLREVSPKIAFRALPLPMRAIRTVVRMCISR